MTADIQPPDLRNPPGYFAFESRTDRRQIPGDILETSPAGASNIRELEGALNRVLLLPIEWYPLTPHLVEVASRTSPQRSDVQPQKIIELVAKEWQTTVEALLGRDRSQKIAQPRQSPCIHRKETDDPFPK